MIFENPSVPISELPAIKDAAFHRLAPAYCTVQYTGILIFFSVLFFVWLALVFTLKELTSIVINAIFIAWLVLFALRMILVKKHYRAAGYSLREQDISYRRGVLVHSLTTIPYSRIQHVEISQGLIQSAFNLATLRIYTAGGQQSDLAIPGLPHTDAERIKEFILEKIGSISPIIENQKS